jgi:hypothetical protein
LRVLLGIVKMVPHPFDDVLAPLQLLAVVGWVEHQVSEYALASGAAEVGFEGR